MLCSIEIIGRHGQNLRIIALAEGWLGNREIFHKVLDPKKSFANIAADVSGAAEIFGGLSVSKIDGENFCH
jgi:hypothetical protein